MVGVTSARNSRNRSERPMQNQHDALALFAISSQHSLK
jgi:hypothetical protein